VPHRTDAKEIARHLGLEARGGLRNDLLRRFSGPASTLVTKDHGDNVAFVDLAQKGYDNRGVGCSDAFVQLLSIVQSQRFFRDTEDSGNICLWKTPRRQRFYLLS
jgi:hypothetical protein